MSADRMSDDLGAEREIDLRGWLNAARAYWWIAAAGLVAGAVLGGLYSLGGPSATYSASATIARGQAFNPSGSQPVLGYLTNVIAIQDYATSPQVVATVSAKSGMTRSELRNHIVISTFTSEGTPSTTNTGSTLVAITVTGKKPKKVETAANVLTHLIQVKTTTPYVLQSISFYQVKLKNFAIRIGTLQSALAKLNAVLAHPAGITPLEQLVIADELDSKEAALGQTLDSQTTAQQQLTLAKLVEETQIVQLAQAEKVSRFSSRRNAILFGALIGLIAGALVATVLGLRSTRVTSV